MRFLTPGALGAETSRLGVTLVEVLQLTGTRRCVGVARPTHNGGAFEDHQPHENPQRRSLPIRVSTSEQQRGLCFKPGCRGIGLGTGCLMGPLSTNHHHHEGEALWAKSYRSTAPSYR